MRRKATLSILIVVVLLCNTISVFAKDDIPSSWAWDEIEEAKALGVIPVDMQNNYTSNITRAEFCKVLISFLESKCEFSIMELLNILDKSVDEASFFDTRASYILQASALGIVSGIGGGVFNPEGVITRQEVAIMLKNMCDAIELIVKEETPVDFSDRSEIAAWAKDAVDFVCSTTVRNGTLMNGVADGKFAPYGLLTREQAYCVFYRLYDASLYVSQRVKTSVIETEAISSSGNYEWFYNYNSPFKGYIFPTKNGFQLINAYNGTLLIEDYDSGSGKTSERRLQLELPIFGGIHKASDGHYYLLCGEADYTENDSEVIRIIKYDENWGKLASSSIRSRRIITRIPFNAGCPRFSDDGRNLIIHTSRERYTSSDGLNHQSNLTIIINMSDLSVRYASPAYPENHVSHSFDQYVLYDGNEIIYLDHGDAYPRSIVIQRESQSGHLSSANIISFTGEIGDNYTGARIGGFEMSEDNYIMSASFNNNNETKSRNALISIIPKNNLKQAETIWLTNYDKDFMVSAPYLVKVNDDCFVLLWEEFLGETAPYGYWEYESGPFQLIPIDSETFDSFVFDFNNEGTLEWIESTYVSYEKNVDTKYAVIDGSGVLLVKPTSIKNARLLPDIQPIVLNGGVAWFSAHTQGLLPDEGVKLVYRHWLPID